MNRGIQTTTIMTQEEYIAKLKRLEEKYKFEKNTLYVEYGISQARFNVGDIITNGHAIIEVEKISAAKMFEEYPYPVYRGKRLTKKLVQAKTGERTNEIHGNRIVELIKPAQQP